MTIEECIKQGINQIKEKEDAYWIIYLLATHILQVDKTYILTHPEQVLEEKEEKDFQEAIQKIKQGIPVQYITNKQEFMDSCFYVNQDVLIPQPDTEILVEEVIQLIKQRKVNILDLCCGSGCIGISLKKFLENSNVVLSDVSQKAIEVAKKNAVLLNVDVQIIQSNLFENIKEKYDMIVSNPPYIETNVISTLSQEVQNEPHIALDGGEDGLTFYRKIIKEAPNYLNKKGYLCLEIGFNQKKAVIQLLQENFENMITKQDLAGNDRVIIAKMKGE